MSHLLEDGYCPDTINLNESKEAKDYWFDCFQDLISKLAKQASKSCTDADSTERANKLKEHYIRELSRLQEDSRSNEVLTIRQYLDLHEDCLHLFGFTDPWKAQKQLENDFAIARLSDRLQEIDKLEADERWTEICRGMLAGNMFDWGAQVVSEMLEKDKNFGLTEAMQCIQKRPWSIDHLDAWLERMRGPPHKCAAIFVDNSGVDITLGVLPFARELLRRGTKVLLCANAGPALNDITSNELNEVLQRCCVQCEVLREAYEQQRLQVFSNGHSSPCLDLLQLPSDVDHALSSVDLIVIEGMGRALHTNLHARFKCESLKVVVVKNGWLAKKLFNSEVFSVILKFEQPGS